MPKRTDIKTILVIGSGPIVIGQACEFDYSGTQACKTLRAEGYKVILINSNPATIMTDTDVASVTYIEPITLDVIERIIIQEKPNAILSTMGGQTALNCALDLYQNKILRKYNCELIGVTPKAIEKAENRKKFKEAISNIGLFSAKSGIARSINEAYTVQQKIMNDHRCTDYPVIIRPSFTMGGSGGGIAYNREEFEEICKRGLDLSPTHELLIEESLIGWKEYEMEVIRDSNDNCIVVCSIENLDPMGIHTGDSITIAPAQTLSDHEYQIMRSASFSILREIGINSGGSNVQFAINPKNGRMIVIEMNPRVSRSSALASKATGFPIAKIATKLAIGYTLDELYNDITGNKIPASFEPSIDYIVTKIPRFAFEKFPNTDKRLTTQMKSVGEVMAVGRTFQESFQKALRSLETGIYGLDERSSDLDEIILEIREPGPDRILYVADAFRIGMTQEEIFEHTSIDRWFLSQILELIQIEKRISKKPLHTLSKQELLYLKQKGFSDKRLGQLFFTSSENIQKIRYSLGIHPVYKRIDTCSAEFSTNTAYMYSSYEAEHGECESHPDNRDKIVVLGGGPNRIGQGIEFDYCCVHAAMAIREDGYETIMINCNPETVSTDYDISDRLYFEPLTLEDVLEIVLIEKPKGVIVQYGGQTPLKLALDLEKFGVPIIGTAPNMIDIAEDRERFQKLLQHLNLRQPENRIARTEEESLKLAKEIGYPLIVRPSYVLGGRAMEIVYDDRDIEIYIQEAVKVSDESPVLLDRFLDNAIECEIDCICDGQRVFIAGVMEHIEQAGIHSGDSACSLPPYSLNQFTVKELCRQTSLIAEHLNVIGLMNIQFAIQKDPGEKKDIIYILEVNPRASRTIPYISKVTGLQLAKIGARCMLGQTLDKQGIIKEIKLPYFAVKEAVFPFNKFPGIDPILGPEMRSTGEVMGIGKTFGEALLKSQLAANIALPGSGNVLLTVKDSDKPQAVKIAKMLHDMGYIIIATRGTADAIESSKIPVKRINKVKEGRPHIVDMIKNGEIDLVFTTVDQTRAAILDSRSIRTTAQANHVAYYTTISGARAVVAGIKAINQLEVYALQNLHAML